MSENHPSKPIRKAGPTTGELVLDRGLALHLLDQMDVIRRKHSGSLPPPATIICALGRRSSQEPLIMKAVMNGRMRLK